MLPPLTGKLAGQTIRSRSAHPPGYEEKYPSTSMFPLWAHDLEPFLRGVVRPGFKLVRGTVTTMFTSGGKPFYKPVSQQRWIRAMIGKAKSELADFRSGVTAANEKLRHMDSSCHHGILWGHTGMWLLCHIKQNVHPDW